MRHVKLTEHFLEQARDLDQGAAGLLTRALLDGRLVRLAATLKAGERGAVPIGGGYVVFCQDERDQDVLTLLTYLSRDTQEVLRRRDDTRRLRLPGGGLIPQAVDRVAVYEWRSGITVEAAGWAIEMTPDEARALGLDLLALTDQDNQEENR